MKVSRSPKSSNREAEFESGIGRFCASLISANARPRKLVYLLRGLSPRLPPQICAGLKVYCFLIAFTFAVLRKTFAAHRCGGTTLRSHQIPQTRKPYGTRKRALSRSTRKVQHETLLVQSAKIVNFGKTRQTVLKTCINLTHHSLTK